MTDLITNAACVNAAGRVFDRPASYLRGLKNALVTHSVVNEDGTPRDGYAEPGETLSFQMAVVNAGIGRLKDVEVSIIPDSRLENPDKLDDISLSIKDHIGTTETTLTSGSGYTIAAGSVQNETTITIDNISMGHVVVIQYSKKVSSP